MHIRMIKKSQKGFTLIELMVTVAIIGVLLAVTAPFIGDMAKNSALRTNANQTLLSMLTARSEATKRNDTVVMCKSSNGTSCSTVATVYWESGWLLFQDLDSDNSVDSGEEIIKVVRELPEGLELRGTAALSNRIRFFADGSANTNGNLTLCDSRGATYARKIILSITGRARVVTYEQDNTITC